MSETVSQAFEGRAIVVTGGGGALGQAVVQRLLHGGAGVHVPAYSESDREALSRLDQTKGSLHVTTGVDLSKESAVVSFYENVGTLWGSIHIAGGFVWGPIRDAALSDFERMLTMNVKTAWLCCREASRRMTVGGRIVNVSARPALVPTPNLAAYAASKGAVATLTQSLAEELRDDGIWVNAIAPSIFDTPINRESMPDADFDAWPKPHELAETIAFLASPENRSTRGAIVPVYGKS